MISQSHVWSRTSTRTRTVQWTHGTSALSFFFPLFFFSGWPKEARHKWRGSACSAGCRCRPGPLVRHLDTDTYGQVKWFVFGWFGEISTELCAAKQAVKRMLNLCSPRRPVAGPSRGRAGAQLKASPGGRHTPGQCHLHRRARCVRRFQTYPGQCANSRMRDKRT